MGVVIAVGLHLENGTTLGTELVDGTSSRVQLVGKSTRIGLKDGITLAPGKCSASRLLRGAANPSVSTRDVLTSFQIINDSVF